jgi:hypothetical protein
LGAKAKHYRRHAARRGFERYDLELSKSDFDAIAKMARRISAAGHPTSEGRVVARQSDSRSLIEIIWRGNHLRAIYSRSMRTIVTFLPPNKQQKSII